MKNKLSFSLTMFGLFLLPTLTYADPSDTDPFGMIKVRSETTEKLAAEVEKLYLASKEVVEKYATEEPNSINGKDFALAGHTVNMLRYRAGILQAFSETAGVDYSKRQVPLKGGMDAIGKIYQQSKSFPKLLDSARKQMATSKFKALVAKMNSFAAAKEWEKAEEAMIDVYAIVDPVATLLVSGQPYQGIDTVRRQIENARTNQAMQAAAELFKTEREMVAPDFAASLTQIQTAIASVASSGKAQWEEVEVTGPQLMEKIGATWAKTQVAAVKTRTLDLLKSGGLGTASPFEQKCNKFGADIVVEMGNLIEAEAARLSAADAQKIYPEYLKAIAPISRQVNTTTNNLQQKLEPSLAKLIAKSPELSNAVKNYKLATDDLLFWRKRYAEAKANQKLAGYPLLSTTHINANTSSAQKPKIYGASNPDPEQAILNAAAPTLIKNCVSELVPPESELGEPGANQVNVTCVDLLRYASSKGLTSRVISRYQQRHFVTVPILGAGDTTFVENAAMDLKADLMVSDQAPALSLEAAYAVATADRADMMKVGGNIYEMFLESLVTRFGNLKDGASIMMPLGDIHIEKVGGPASTRTHVLMRYSVDPHWVQHDYFFVDGLKPVEGS